MAHREAIEKHPFQRAMGLFTLAPTALAPTVTLYDLGNTCFEGAVRIETATKQGVHLQRVLDEDALTALSDGLAKPRTRKRIDPVHQRLGRLEENRHGIARQYDDVTVQDR